MVSAIQLANIPSTVGNFSSLKASDVGERFLGFNIQPDVCALLSLSNLQGAIELPCSEILPVPQMSPYLLGIVNWRGKSTWVVDLAQFMGGEYYSQRCPQATKVTVLMVQMGATTIGLVVDRTISVAVYDAAAAIPVDDNFVATKMRRFLSGYFLDPENRTWLLIDLPKIFQVMSL
jgi:positive phototaxis protein PixI